MIIAKEKDIEIARMLCHGSEKAAQDVPGKIDGTIEAVGGMSLQVARIRAEAAEEVAERAIALCAAILKEATE